MTRSLLAVAFALLATLPAAATIVTVEISGVESADGEIRVGLYDEAQFLKKPLQVVRVKPAKGTVTGTFDIAEGAYALSVIHDVNGNGKLDRNVLGIPKEPYGFSSNPTLFGAPTFDKVRVEIRGDKQVVPIRLR